jgi:hypothetical protein
MPYKAKDPVERFWKHVNKTNTCWIWTGERMKEKPIHIRKGIKQLPYGIFYLINPAKNNKMKQVKAHRYSWEIHKGPIPEGLFVLHKCDNPPCINPSHLFLGTNLDNIKDMVAKGRNKGAKGTRNCKAKLTEDQVREIREACRQGATDATIASQYNVSAGAVWFIRYNVTWQHVK